MDDDPQLFNLNYCYSLETLLESEEEGTIIGGSPSEIFIGTNYGRVIHVRKADNEFKVVGNLVLPARHAVRQIKQASALNIVFIICNNTLFEIRISDFTIVGSKPNISQIAINSNPISEDPFVLQLVLAVIPKQLHFCQKQGARLDVYQKVNTDDTVLTVAYTRSTVCFASKSCYYVYNTSSKMLITLFSFDPQVVCPVICTIDIDEFLLSGMDGLFIFATGQGISKRPPIVLQSVIVKSFFYNPPYIHVLTKSGVVVISLNDMRVHQTLNMEEADSLVSLDGAIYGIKEMHLYSISPVAFEDQISKLVSHERYDEAIQAYEKKIELDFDEDAILNLHLLKAKIAMKYFDDGNFNKAVEMLIESETDPKEVISQFSFVNSDLSSKYNSPQYYQFLEEFLLSIRDLPYTEVYRKVIDTTLLKLFTRNNKYEDLFKLSNLELDYKDCTKFLIDYGLLSYAAEIAWKGGDEDIALDIWTQIVSKNSGNTAFNVDIIAERIVRLSNPLLVARVLTWLVDIRPKQCLEIILNSASVDYETAKTLLKRHPDLFKLYLESQQLNADVAKELCLIYINEIAGGDSSNRQKLRSLLLKSTKNERIDIMSHMEKPGFDVEKLLCDSEYSLNNVLNLIISKYNDYDAAELLCGHYLVSHPELSLSLLEGYINSNEEGYREYDVSNRISNLLNRMESHVDAHKVLQILPDKISLTEASGFLKKLISHREEQLKTTKLKNSLLSRILTIDTVQVPNQKIIIDESSRCEVCKMLITFEEPLSYLSTGFTVHSKCIKHPNLCPITNTVLF